MSVESIYTTQLQAGLGLVDETRQLLQLWEPGMSAALLYDLALRSGYFSGMSARRLLNVVKECFAPRYLVRNGYPAQALKIAMEVIPPAAFEQLLFLYTARANRILADFIKETYWTKYTQGHLSISNEDARDFVLKANQHGKTQKSWSDSTLRRVSSYLTGTCAEFHLLEAGTRSLRRIQVFRLEPVVAAWLAYDLHFQGLGDNVVVQHSDWQLFGMESEVVRQQLRQLSLKGYFIIQTTTNSTHLSWNYQNWEELIHGLNK